MSTSFFFSRSKTLLELKKNLNKQLYLFCFKGIEKTRELFNSKLFFYSNIFLIQNAIIFFYIIMIYIKKIINVNSD
jgi:hypothetical protein